METIPAFKTKDGSVFTSKVDAIAYEKRDEHLAKVEAFLETTTYSRGQRTQAKNTALRFLAWTEYQAELETEEEKDTDEQQNN